MKRIFVLLAVAVAGLGASGGWVVEGVRVAADPPALCASTFRYPVFNIPLDGWSDFDLMADTNNFSVSGGTNSLYWFNSVGPSSCSNFYKFARADLHAQLY
ncbi:MAG: hypothetical protein WCK89_16545, partial [bacterium]